MAKFAVVDRELPSLVSEHLRYLPRLILCPTLLASLAKHTYMLEKSSATLGVAVAFFKKSVFSLIASSFLV